MLRPPEGVRPDDLDPSLRVWGLGFGVWGLRFAVWGSGPTEEVTPRARPLETGVLTDPLLLPSPMSKVRTHFRPLQAVERLAK